MTFAPGLSAIMNESQTGRSSISDLSLVWYVFLSSELRDIAVIIGRSQQTSILFSHRPRDISQIWSMVIQSIQILDSRIMTIFFVIYSSMPTTTIKTAIQFLKEKNLYDDFVAWRWVSKHPQGYHRRRYWKTQVAKSSEYKEVYQALYGWGFECSTFSWNRTTHLYTISLYRSGQFAKFKVEYPKLLCDKQHTETLFLAAQK